jgi:hypothetical protein
MEKENWIKVDKVLPRLNDWIRALDLHISPMSGQSRLWLHTIVRGPPRTTYVHGYKTPQQRPSRALVPVTNDRATILDLLGFDKPKSVLQELNRAETERMICSILCSSKFFNPSMVTNTARGNKLSGTSTLFSYVQETWGKTLVTEKHKRDNDQVRDAVHMVIAHKFPTVALAKTAFSDHERMLGRLEEILWGPSLPPGNCEAIYDSIFQYHQRWERYLELRGIQTLDALCVSDPAKALEDWLQFRGGPDTIPHDWEIFYG